MAWEGGEDMKTKYIVAFVTLSGALLISASLYAHHAGNLYDWRNPVTLTGTVTEYLFVNPHTQIRFEVTGEDGVVTKWVAESQPVQKLIRTGWDANTLKAGDRITVTGAPHKGGDKAMGVVRLVGPTGQVLNQGVE